MTVTPIDQVLAEGNCGEATNRGEEARVQTCGATNRNRIQGRRGQASGPCITKPFSSSREGGHTPKVGRRSPCKESSRSYPGRSVRRTWE